MTEPRHRLLQRQLARHSATEPTLPPAVVALLREIDRAYHQSDDDRLLLERSLELVSEELIQRNEDVVLALESATAATFRYCELSDEMAWEGHPLPFAPGVRGRIAGPAELLFEPVLVQDRGGLRAALRAALVNGAPFTTRFRVHGQAAAVRWLEARGDRKSVV